MTPKEKAEELMNRYIDASVVIDDGIEYYHKYPYTLAKQCALIAVDEILEAILQIYETIEERKYWQEVRNEIEKL